MTDAPKKPRGFAAMTPERRREIAAIGGASVPPEIDLATRSRQVRRQLEREAAKSKKR
jgi:hypothetical protein